MAVREAGAVAADAEYKKTQNYTHLSLSHNFVPIAMETYIIYIDSAAVEATRRESSAIRTLAHMYTYR